ncbi:preprotein translocase subunit YajC [Vallitalea pronyensis]|uniref:Preprotein translocase subunit YajC n=1 Tax=Vallitalea pronyensis TaxID=1348613 RepID=A0A8J8MLI1_9FIRM|nr:preprotein translocase subunit YajC [Vallitalea pronyensis]QUI23724.1 preprotein translocase subunit YajC [Vallitalea pronyensis]
MSNLFLLNEGTQGSMMTLIIYVVVLFGFMYFILIRPQKKRQREVDSMQSNVKIGDSVMTNGGIFGRVVDSINDVVIVELGTNKSVRVPIQRNAIAAIKEPDLTINRDEEIEEVKEVKEEEK